MTGQRADVVDWGDHLVKYGVYRKGHQISETEGIQINEPLVSHLSPLGWSSGDYIWHNNIKLGSGKHLFLNCAANMA